MQHDAGLIKVVFASGPDRLNQALIDRVNTIHREIACYVVGEFEPQPGSCTEWIPWHVRRSFRQNLAAVRAALRDKRIRTAAMLLSPGTPLMAMRIAAWMVTAGVLVVYDEDFRIVRGAGWGKYLVRRARENAGSRRARQWLHRLSHPGEAEIPVRARAAQLYGLGASRLRPRLRERPMAGPGQSAERSLHCDSKPQWT